MSRKSNSSSRLRQRRLYAERLEDRRLLASLLGGNENLIPRSELIKPLETIVDSMRHESDRFVVKFRDDLPIRLRDGELVELDGETQEIKLSPSHLGGEHVQAVLDLVDQGGWQRMDSIAEEKLASQRHVAQLNLGRQIADLNSYFYVTVSDSSEMPFIIDAFNSLEIVELATPIPRLVAPPSQPGSDNGSGLGNQPPPPPIPGDFQSNQGYLNAAPNGIGATEVWNQYGIRGSGIQVVDIEYTFDDLHEDLPFVNVIGPTPEDPGFGPDHGTAVLGEMAGVDNGWGVTGIAPDSQYYFAGAFTGNRYLLAEALTVATDALDAGDIILIEQQTSGPNFDPFSGSQFGYVPVEWFEPYYSRIQTAVGNGIIVVEAAANGSQDLDDPIYSTGNNGHFPFLAENDSGAIIVGAGASSGAFQPARSRLSFSNYGSRVDVQGWGHNVWTTGYGDAYSQEGEHLYFTDSFSGTSSASPIVTGAASLVQSAYKDLTGDVLTPAAMREVLRETGTPQQDGPNPITQNIGPFPDALAAIEQVLSALSFELTIGPASTEYVEDSPAVAIAAGSTVTDADFSNGMLMRVTITDGWQQGDMLTITNGNGIIVGTNGSVRYNGQLLGSLTSLPQGFSLLFNTLATRDSLQAILRNVSFQHTTGGPTDDIREVEFRVGGTERRSVQVAVQPVPDLPIAGSGQLPEMLEDGNIIQGARLSNLDGLFSDVDFGDQFTGMVVVGNPSRADEGVWYYSTNGGVTWVPVGAVNDADLSLVVSASTYFGYMPAPNFSGVAEALQVRVLDSEYTGSFSSVELGIRQPLLAQYFGIVSQNIGSLGIHVVNVNDPPFATIPSLTVNAVQESPLSYILEENYVEDIDSELVWSVTGAGGAPLPDWLSFSSSTRRLTGTPRNRDVASYQLTVSATDGQFTATVPLTLNVANINDRPESLRFDALPLLEGVAGVSIGTLFAIDPDNDPITWSSSDSRIAVNGSQVVLVSALDYETEQHIPVTFLATDSGTPSEVSQLSVVLHVVDVNEFYPDLDSEDFEVLSGTPGGTVLKQLTAPDGDTLQTVRFAIRGGDRNDFSLGENTGELRFLPDADVRIKTEYRIFVDAFDNGNPRRSTAALFNVRVLPVNNHPPQVAPGQGFLFDENLAAGTVIGQIEASDEDDNPIQFEMLEVIGGALNWVSLDPITGVVSVTGAHSFDFESGIQHAVRIRVVETVSPHRSVEAVLPIQLVDVNDRPYGLEPVSVWTSRQGVAAGPFLVLDQDTSNDGYSFATSDSRFEVRNGILSLRPDRHFDASLAGTNTSAIVTVTDISDPSSIAELPITIRIVASLPWQNPLNPLDVNRDGRVNSLDALQIINALNSGQNRQLGSLRLFEQMSLPEYDTNGDSRLSSVDALLVINRLNNDPQGEGESDARLPTSANAISHPEAWLLAFDQLEELRNRRRR